MSNAACLAIILVNAMEEETVYWKSKRSIWAKAWLKRRGVLGHDNLIIELELYSPLDYKNYVQMCPSTFGELLELITPLVQTEDTSMREATSPKQRLFATLHFLASGLTFENLKFDTDEMVTCYNSSQTCPWKLQTAAQPDCCATEFKPV
jgi:hypothetical protein